MKRHINELLYDTGDVNPLKDTGKLMLRILFGLSLALNHGWPTLRGFVAGVQDFPDPLGLGPEITMLMAGSSEFVLALFVAAGFFTRISALIIVINFSVAFFIFHAGDPFADKELAYLYLSSMIAVFLSGPGNYSLDHFISEFGFRNPDNPVE